MTREEIRKEIRELIESNYDGRNPSYPEFIGFRPMKFLNALLPLLDKLGVAIKVKRELPLLNSDDNPLEYLARKSEQRNMLKAGYTAWEPLIEEEKWAKT